MKEGLKPIEAAEKTKPTLDLSDYKLINQSSAQKIIDKWKKGKEGKYYWITDIDGKDYWINTFTDGDTNHYKKSEFAEIKFPLTAVEQQGAQYKKEVIGVLEQRTQLLQDNKVPNLDKAKERCARGERGIFWFNLPGGGIGVYDYSEGKEEPELGTLKQRTQLFQDNYVSDLDIAMEKCAKGKRGIFWFNLPGGGVGVCDYSEGKEKPVISNHTSMKGFVFVLSNRKKI